MKALISKLMNFLEAKTYEIKHRRPHILDVVVGMFLAMAVAFLFSSCAVPVPLIIEVQAPERPPIFAGETEYV